MILSIYCLAAAAVSAAFLAMALYGAWLSWRECRAEADAGAVGPMGGRIGTMPGTTTGSNPRHDADQQPAADSETMSAEGWEGCRGYLDGEWARALRGTRPRHREWSSLRRPEPGPRGEE
ncbi:hypothetical protein SAMN05660831_02080 [Thiohalospira halophila DSM 15071]|uniref:Uncharacterized protein n=1 Tax=Thiohalospira halophila DSM 15071 TaxID=1123397 RepID=A0A1I1UI01_9GAMM|nr:hypothetical protein [Thiohalospira halophila]SFD67560.1 hypothetical protein SAMN05660831_02080 [Thiohalospira halophila DSM 15071]